MLWSYPLGMQSLAFNCYNTAPPKHLTVPQRGGFFIPGDGRGQLGICKSKFKSILKNEKVEAEGQTLLALEAPSMHFL